MKQQINEIKRMQLLAGIINESQLNEIDNLPDWITSIEQEQPGFILLYVTDSWYNTNKEKIIDNIKKAILIRSTILQKRLDKIPGYDPKEDYITPEGATYIDGKLKGINSSDNKKSKEDSIKRAISDIEKRKFIDGDDIEGIIPDNDMQQILAYIKEKYKVEKPKEINFLVK